MARAESPAKEGAGAGPSATQPPHTHLPYSSREEPRIPALAAGPPSRAFSTSTPFTPSCSTAGKGSAGEAGAGRWGQCQWCESWYCHGQEPFRQSEAGSFAATDVPSWPGPLAPEWQLCLTLPPSHHAPALPCPAPAPVPAPTPAPPTRLVWGEADAHDGPHHLAKLDDLQVAKRR